MSSLVKQKGLLVCNTKGCFDNLEVEQRPFVIMAVLGSGVEQEGADTRVVDRGFFEGYDEVQR